MIKSNASSESMSIEVTKLQLLPCQHVMHVSDGMPEEEDEEAFARTMKAQSFAVKVRERCVWYHLPLSYLI